MMMMYLSGTLSISISSNALYNTLQGTQARLHWAVYISFDKKFGDAPNLQTLEKWSDHNTRSYIHYSLREVHGLFNIPRLPLQ